MRQKPSFQEALKFWIKLGFISFGGPAGQIAIMHEYLVDKKKWISESRFLHALNYCMILPGPEAQQLATYIGWLLHGTRGGLAAGILFILPSMFILLGLSIVYVSFGSVPWIYAIFNGFKPAVIAIVIIALIKIGKKSLHTPFHYIVAISAFVCLYFFNFPFPLIILGAILLALVSQKIKSLTDSSNQASEKQILKDETEYFINNTSFNHQGGLSYRILSKQMLFGIMLWVLPLGGLFFLTTDFEFWKKLSLFFTQSAFVTFGGAYSVLAYVAQVSVEKFNWLSNLEMIDGLALGETTPGPLIMVLVFVGFMAGHNHFAGSIAMGTLGLLTTTYYTFLPCFLFIFIGAPLIEQTQNNQKLKEILGLVTAAVVGVILNLTIYLARAVLFPTELSISGINWIMLIWVFFSFIALYRFKVNIILWIGISSIFGLATYFLTL